MQDARRAGAPVVGRTGILPAQLHEGTIVEDALPWVEAATVLIVALVVGLMFRSPARRFSRSDGGGRVPDGAARDRAAGRRHRATVPDLLKPLMVALVLGVVTDYSIFYRPPCGRT